MNRRGFLDFAEKQIDIAIRGKKNLSILYLDLNEMKSINDTLGHRAGDQALIDIADLLRKIFRSSDIIARIGGDEFTTLIVDPQSADIEKIINNKIQNSLRTHNKEMKRDYTLSVSMGFAHFNPKRPSSIDRLMALADSLMYEDKQRQRVRKNATS